MIRILFAVIAISSLSACLSVIPEGDAPEALYRFGPVEAGEGVELTRSVVVREPESPRVLGGIEIVARDGRGALRLVDGVEWADRAPRLFQYTLLDYLSTGHDGIAMLPETGARAEFILTWRISEFALNGDTAVARIELTLLDGIKREPVARRVLKSEVRAENDRSRSRAEAMAEAGRNVVEQAAGFVAEAVRTED